VKKILFSLMLLVGALYAEDGYPDEPVIEEYVEDPSGTRNNNRGSYQNDMLKAGSSMAITVVGQGVAPTFASSPAQAYALAKRAAMSDAYRLMAEKINGVRVEGKDTIRNMAIKNSTVRTRVGALVKNASVVGTTYKEGLCEVEMEITLDYNSF
jgi:hypothetical protein